MAQPKYNIGQTVIGANTGSKYLIQHIEPVGSGTFRYSGIRLLNGDGSLPRPGRLFSEIQNILLPDPNCLVEDGPVTYAV